MALLHKGGLKLCLQLLVLDDLSAIVAAVVPWHSGTNNRDKAAMIMGRMGSFRLLGVAKAT